MKPLANGTGLSMGLKISSAVQQYGIAGSFTWPPPMLQLENLTWRLMRWVRPR